MRDVPFYFSRPSAMLEKVREMPNLIGVRHMPIWTGMRHMPVSPILSYITQWSFANIFLFILRLIIYLFVE